MRLGQESLSGLSSQVVTCHYDRSAQQVGIVHFGIGAFHRAHQAWYTDACLSAGEAGWLIAGVSMRSPTVAEQLNPQDGLYTLTERSSSGSHTCVIGAVREVLLGESDRQAIIARMANPACTLVSFTVTEKGYCRTPTGDLDLAAAAHGFYPLLTAAMRQRRDAGLPGLTLLSCDNLAHNGRVLGKLVSQWLDHAEPDLQPWFTAHCRSPNSMVDRIVPASTEVDRNELEQRTGVRDDGAVFTEPFSQWVIEDAFAGPRPRWEEHGAQIVADVAPYETAKLRMLNGAHSLLAYCGLREGLTYVHEAVAHPRLRPLTVRLMLDEAAPTIAAGEGQDLAAYAHALIARFDNPQLHHRLAQIAMDGSQKLPQRWLETLAANQYDGRQCPAILQGLAAWISHLRGAHGPVDDPLAEPLSTAASAPDPVNALFGSGGLLVSHWRPTAADHAAILANLA